MRVKETAEKERALVEARSDVEEAGKVVNERKSEEQAAMETFRQSKLARDSFVQGGSTGVVPGIHCAGIVFNTIGLFFRS